MQRRRIRAGPVELAVVEAGKGGLPVLLVHGFTGAKEDLAATVELLGGQGWHAVAPDLRGHGASEQPPGEDGYDFPLLAADLLAMADALGWHRFVLVGHSMGGALGQLVALDAPERLRALVLIATFHGPVPGVDPVLVELGSAIVRQTGMEGLARALAARRAADPASLASFERSEQARPGHAAESDRKLLASSPDMWLALAPRFLTQPDRLTRLATIDLPTLVVVGDQDDTMLDDCRRIGATIPGARLVIVAGAGHAPQIEDPPAWESALLPFLASLG